MPAMGSNEAFALSAFDHAVSSGYQCGQPSIHRRPSRQGEHEQEHDSLPRADTGKDAWLFLLGSFCIEALIWGKCCLEKLGTFNCLVSSSPPSCLCHCNWPAVFVIECNWDLAEQHDLLLPNPSRIHYMSRNLLCTNNFQASRTLSVSFRSTTQPIHLSPMNPLVSPSSVLWPW